MIYIVATDFNPSKIGAYFREFPSERFILLIIYYSETGLKFSFIKMGRTYGSLIRDLP
ncbi:hypothetical protein [Flavobacterium johnsoniae]|uniref:hypothetical protein n=1 Tax=Flavobacterium TaxID=237 RepID=UPI0009235FE8|nr:hypothetical protein [Flavobacterium johnsoniae]WQG81237.1 hypothetical protein SR927_24885 [Flavobacterium johnsoniae UW101]SHL36212.1 hypothetical protein SAMN05444146_3598 [Flavobacterium johnsoniae]